MNSAKEHQAATPAADAWTAVGARAVDVTFQAVDDAEEAEAFYLGTVRWTRRAHRFHAHNTGPGDVLLTYTGGIHEFTGDLASRRHVLPAGAGYDATEDLARFNNGRLVITPDAGPGVDDPRANAIAYAIRMLSTSMAVAIFPGMSLKVERRKGSFGIVVTSQRAPLTRLHGRVTDRHGRTASVSATFDPAQEVGPERFVRLPAGLDLDPVVAELDVTLTYPAEARLAWLVEETA